MNSPDFFIKLFAGVSKSLLRLRNGRFVSVNITRNYSFCCCLSFPGARVRRLATHPTEQSWVVSAVQGNNEVTVWDLETGARRQALWASHTPPLSQTQVCYLRNVKYVEVEKEYSQIVKTLLKTL